MSQFKRFLGWAVILSFLLVLFPLSIASADNITVSIEAPDGALDAGSDFVARVNITEVTDLDSFQFDITYDPNVIQATDVTGGLIAATNVPTNWNVASPSGTIIVIGNLSGASGVTGSGYLAEIHFFVVGSDGSTSDITLSGGKLFDNIAVGIPVTEWQGDSVSVSGTATKPIIAFSPSRLSFSAVESGDNPADQTLEIWNSGVGTLDWEVSDDADWLSSSPTSGSSTGEKDEVTISVDISGMTAGNYEASISISAPETTARTASVKLYIEGEEVVETPVEPPETPPGFSVSPIQVSPEQVQPNEQVEISIDITNTGGETGNYTAALYINDTTEDSRAVSISPGSTQTVMFTVTKSEPGTYTISLGGQQGQFTVADSQPAPSCGSGTGTMLALSIIIVPLFVVARRRQT